jgi:hypothetical protein
MNNIEKDKYCVLMAEIEIRLEAIDALYKGKQPKGYGVINIESICLQMRKVLELIAFSSLITHKDAYENVRNDIRKDWHAERILKKVESINQYYYPVALTDPKYNNKPLKRGGYLTRKQFSALYDQCGKILHARNPFNRYDKPLAFNSKIPENVKRIKELLSVHCITFMESNEVIFVKVPFGKKKEEIEFYQGELK